MNSAPRPLASIASPGWSASHGRRPWQNALTLATALAVVSSAGLHAQAPDTCVVRRNNEPYFYNALATDPGTGRAYNLETYQPPGYWSAAPTDPGVSAGQLSWRWIPAAVNQRLDVRDVSGFEVYLRPSAPTTPFPQTGYIPEWAMVPTAGRLDGGRAPDLALPPHIVVPQASFVFPSAGAHRARVAFGAAVPVTSADVCVTLRWQGGEHRLAAGAQGLVGTTDEAPWRVPTWGHADPVAGTVTVVDPLALLGQYTTLWTTYYEASPVVVAHSDYAHMRRLPPQLPLFTGYNDAAGLSDLALQPVALGWSADVGVSRGFSLCVPLFDLRLALPTTGVPLFGTTFEVDATSPLLGTLSSVGYWGFADASGWFDGPRLTFPATTTSLLGVFVGVEFLALDPVTFGVLDSSQAHWMEIGNS